mgnify:CR=1 FL=1
MHADNVGIAVGDTITVGGEAYRVVGLIAYVNYATLHEKSTDLMFDALKFNVAMVTEDGFARLHEKVHYDYAWNYVTEPADEAAEKICRMIYESLLTQWCRRMRSLRIMYRNMRTLPFILRRMIWDLTRRWAVCCSIF